jgi:mRNA-degrading endonuclease RelE of RelBE toxin-antitoxin system
MPPKGAKKAVRATEERTSPLPYTVEMTAAAEAVYVDLYRKAKAAEANGHPESAHCTTFNMVKEAVKTIIPRDPLNKSYALRGKLSNIFRLRKGRLRVCWIASSQTRRICILFIAQTLRKEGDANDPYVIFQNLLESGRFDEVMRELKVKMPHAKR